MGKRRKMTDKQMAAAIGNSIGDRLVDRFKRFGERFWRQDLRTRYGIAILISFVVMPALAIALAELLMWLL